MKSTLLEVLVPRLLAFEVFLLPVVLAGPPKYPFPQHVTYSTEALRPSHRTQSQMDEDVRAAYARWKASYLAQAGTEPDGHPRYRVKLASAATSATVSEGQGYGMLIVALMAGDDADAQPLFDGLWEYFNDHRSPIDSRLMDWHVPADETAEPGNDDSAFDGDADIAFGLLLADQQWGSGGRVNYRREAGEVMAGVLASEIGPQSRLPMLGDWVQPNGDPSNQYTPRSSDFMPDHFRAFARASGDAPWNAVVVACQESVASLQANYSPVTGLLPDFIVPISATDHTPKPAPAGFLEGPNDGFYYYNAGRDPWRLGTDALINGDPLSTSQTLRMARWIRSAAGGNPQNIKSGYQLDGTPILPGDYFTSFFAAPFGVAAMLAPEQQPWLNDVYDAVRLQEEGYYEDSITLLSLLVMTHNYWDPTRPPQAASLGTAFFLR